MYKKFLRICFISNLLLACFLQISCLTKINNIGSNLKSSRRKGILEDNKPKIIAKHRCSHDNSPQPKLVKNRMYSELSTPEFAKMYADAEWAPIRIHVDFTKLESQKNKEVPNEHVEAVKKVILRAKEVLEKLLKVKRLTKPLKPSTRNRYQASFTPQFSPDVKDKGVEADLLLSVWFSDDIQGSTVAAASGLEFEDHSGRPIVGIVRYNKDFQIKKNMTKAGLATAIHEIAHILVFNSGYYDKFIDPKTLNKIPKDKVIKDATINGEPRKLMILPSVVKAARKHFNCDKLEGIELENQGGDGTVFSHWEERVMLGDLMIGEDSAENVISEMTLAVFDDSGWYQTNPYTGGLFVHGLNKGCDFVHEKCVVNGITKFKNEFCVGANEYTCDSSHRQRTFCSIQTLEETIPTNFRYFKDPKLGGTMPLSDFCPIPVKNSDPEDDLKHSCVYGQKSDLSTMAQYETIGSNSACFVSDVQNKSGGFYDFTEGKGFASACYEYKCNDKELIVEVSLGGKFYKCPKEGGPVKVEIDAKVKGTVHCMEYNLICNQTVKCNGIHECAMKESKRKDNLKFDYTSKTVAAGTGI